MSQQQQSKKDIPFKLLSDGNKMPMLGFGTFQFPENEVGEVLKTAILDQGYRLIDTAPTYGNEKAIGNALKECFD